MIRRSVVLAYLVSSLAPLAPLACGGEAPAPALPAPAASDSAPAPVASTPPPAPSDTAPVAIEPTPEEKKKAEAAKKLQDDRMAWQTSDAAEVARWTPEMHAAAKALADKSYPTLKSGLTATLASPIRLPGHAARDKYRHPQETLAFFGVKPTSVVLDFGPGDGWFTEVLAPLLSKRGKYIATSGDPNGAPDSRGTFNAQKWQGFLAHSPEAFGKVQTVVVDNKAPALPLDGTVDVILLMREAHGMVENKILDQWLPVFQKALKKGGVLGIEEHRAAPGANPDESAKKGYLPEAWLIEKVTAAGFKLADKSEINANPKDTKDYAEGVWVLPPTFILKDKDHDKYAAIGESDRMTLKFVKVSK
jgi:predicted methyltransferase